MTRMTREKVVLDVQGPRMRYGTHEVLHEVSLRVRRGEVLVLLGPNGAGKTTTSPTTTTGATTRATTTTGATTTGPTSTTGQTTSTTAP